jgi:GNAT superfamily N-acetyltransferase
MRSPCAEAATTTIRRARSTDAERLTAIAHAAKRHWRYPARWIRLWRDDLTVRPAFIRTHPVYCAVRDQDIVGFYALSGSGSEHELEHMWVDPDHMGKRIGSALFDHALATVRSRRGRRLTIAADPNAEGFYRSLGARRIGEVASRPAGRVLPLLRVELRKTGRRIATGEHGAEHG